MLQRLASQAAALDLTLEVLSTLQQACLNYAMQYHGPF